MTNLHKAMLLGAALAVSAPENALAQTSSLFGGDLEINAEATVETRVFTQSPQFAGQLDALQTAVSFKPEIYWSSGSGAHQVTLIPYVRIDAQDSHRSLLDLREAYYRYAGDEVEFLIGLNKVFWGVTESRHLVDIINQSDATENIDEEEKLGQPMVKLTFLKEWGQVDLFALPGFRDRDFPGFDGRFRAPLVVNEDEAVFESGARRGHVDFAARYSNYFGDWDVGVSAFRGTSREPDFRLTPQGDGLAPVYSIITQFGADIQYTKDAWLWKFEGIVREGQGDAFFASVAGFEYTLYQIFDRAWDLGLLAEYLYDGRDAFSFTDPSLDFSTFQTPAPPTIFDNDIFAGARLALNDAQDASALLGAVMDAEDGSTAMFLEAERRLGQNWFMEIEARLFFNIESDNTAAVFAKDDFINLRLTRYF